MNCTVHIDGKELQFPLGGEFFWGPDQVIYDKHDNIIENTSWEQQGYAVVDLMQANMHQHLQQTMTNLIRNLLSMQGVQVDENFQLDQYHRYADDAIHQQIILQTRDLTYADLAMDTRVILDTISHALRREVCIENPGLQKEVVILRISRPNSLDINPPHRDGYLDIWKNTVNLWMPIAGCDENSTLPVIPASHYWNEKDLCRTEASGANINGLKYRVPGIAKTNFGLNMIRPRLVGGQILVFTPFLVHGCAVNWNAQSTRFSLELRLFDACKKAIAN